MRWLSLLTDLSLIPETHDGRRRVSAPESSQAAMYARMCADIHQHRNEKTRQVIDISPLCRDLFSKRPFYE